MKYLIFLFLLMLGCYSKNDTTDKTGLSGKVIKIVDGDTYDLLLDNLTTKRIRMEGIDAPEKGMPFYQAAKNNLGKLCFGQVVKIELTNTDKYGRAIAKTYLANGNELGLLMVEAGFAWHFKKYSSDIKLANAENEARNRKIGIWSEAHPIAPWDVRNLHRQGVSTIDSFKNSKIIKN